MSNSSGTARPTGELGLQVIRASDSEIRGQFDQLAALSSWPAKELSLAEIAYYGLPRKGLDERVNAWRASNFRNLMRGARKVALARTFRLNNLYGSLYLTHIRADGEVVELGLASMRVVTTAGVNFLVDAMQGTVEPEILKYHGIGTGNTAEAAGDTALVTESTTALNPDSTRATGSLTEGASANIFRTVGTLTADATIAAVEHGIFSQPSTGGGTLLDRSVFSTVTLASGDSLQATYDLTFSAGG
jgi:hypothetical protein